MMRNTITRTIETTEIYFSAISVENGIPTFVKQPAMIVNGKLSTEDANKVIKKRFKDGIYIVTDVEVTEQLYEISVEEFLKYATPVNK